MIRRFPILTRTAHDPRTPPFKHVITGTMSYFLFFLTMGPDGRLAANGLQSDHDYLA
jgi:hypothetical protein